MPPTQMQFYRRPERIGPAGGKCSPMIVSMPSARRMQDESQQLPPWIASACSSVVGQRFGRAEQVPALVAAPRGQEELPLGRCQIRPAVAVDECVLHKYRVPLEVV